MEIRQNLELRTVRKSKVTHLAFVFYGAALRSAEGSVMSMESPLLFCSADVKHSQQLYRFKSEYRVSKTLIFEQFKLIAQIL